MEGFDSRRFYCRCIMFVCKIVRTGTEITEQFSEISSIFRFSDMVEYFPKILSRFPVTLLIVVVSVAGGLVLGFILAAARIFKIPVLKELAALYISFVRGTPILVQLFVVYYGLPLLVAP